jgi:vitamin B12 transporter
MKRLGSGLIIPLFVVARVHAQETQTLEPAVVTATKIEEPVERLGAVVTIITADDLARHNCPTVADALRDVPGVQVQRSGSLGKLTELRTAGRPRSRCRFSSTAFA